MFEFLWKTNKIEAIKMLSHIKQTNNLADIYPDTSSELCNKHAKLLSSLKGTFEDIYDGMEPEKFVIVNGVAKVLDLCGDMQLSFALENGVTVLLKKTYENEDVYINGNHIEEEIIFDSHGKHIEGIHEKVDQIRDIIHLIRSRSTKNKPFFGAILYVHSNIGQNLFAFQECFMLGVLIALLYIHDELENSNKSQILAILQEVDPSLSAKVITNILDDYQINKCNIEHAKQSTARPVSDIQITLPDSTSEYSIKNLASNESIKFNQNFSFRSVSQKQSKHLCSTTAGSNNSISSLEEASSLLKEEISSLKVNLGDSSKLILCRLDLSHDQLAAYQAKMKKIKDISDHLSHQKQDLLEFSMAENNWTLNDYAEENRTLLKNFMSGKITFSSYLKQKHELDLSYQIFDQEVIELIQQIKTQAKFIQNFCIIQGTVLLISMQKQYYAEIMCYLRRLLNEQKMSTYHFLQTRHQFDQDKFNAEIGEIMFTSSASSGCAVYTLSEDIWI